MSSNFSSTIHLSSAAVADEISRVDELIAEMVQQTPEGIREKLEHVLRRPGKRVRSTLLLHLARTGEDFPEADRMARAAASIEMLHLASLVHDDVIDATEMRRGQETVHALWGNRIAVLVGDYALAKSLEFVVSDPDKRIPLAISRVSGELVSGEILELILTGKEITREQYESIVSGKTAALLEASTVCGALLAGHTPQVVEECRLLGRHIGFGFQIVDDLLDFGVGAGELGKSKYTDLCNGVMTLPTILFFQMATAEEQKEMRLLRSLVKTEPERAEEIVQLLFEAGAIDAAKREVNEHFSEAQRIISSLLASESRSFLIEIVAAMENRSH